MKEYPRRRDVRETLLSVSRLLERNSTVSYDEFGVDQQDFNRDFLTEVRDMLRVGASLSNALLAIAAAEEDEDVSSEDLSELFAELGCHAELAAADVSGDIPVDEDAEVEWRHAVDEIEDALVNNPAYRGMIINLIVNELGPFAAQE